MADFPTIGPLPHLVEGELPSFPQSRPAEGLQSQKTQRRKTQMLTEGIVRGQPSSGSGHMDDGLGVRPEFLVRLQMVAQLTLRFISVCDEGTSSHLSRLHMMKVVGKQEV